MRNAQAQLTSILITRSFMAASCEANRFSVPARRLFVAVSAVARVCSISVTLRSSRVWPCVTFTSMSVMSARRFPSNYFTYHVITKSMDLSYFKWNVNNKFTSDVTVLEWV